MNANFNEESSSMRHEAGSFYIFIPQIELDEDEGISILSATLAWSDSPLSTFEESIHSYELSLYQHWPVKKNTLKLISDLFILLFKGKFDLLAGCFTFVYTV
ncbi:hypothetical protein CK203_086916 [Vitis vinifera]|uniref:Uncharacterized protein n=1 Tax=Vitis vinifera TaxID=29760 RepID=A0A438EAU1_VITVI|nr:hypothetical protein CK203_086916 [Vitis vinifera]